MQTRANMEAKAGELFLVEGSLGSSWPPAGPHPWKGPWFGRAACHHQSSDKALPSPSPVPGAGSGTLPPAGWALGGGQPHSCFTHHHPHPPHPVTETPREPTLRSGPRVGLACHLAWTPRCA